MNSFPLKPRYRVQPGYARNWRTATDNDLIRDGQNPNDYLPIPIEERFKKANKVSRNITIVCIVLEVLHLFLILIN